MNNLFGSEQELFPNSSLLVETIDEYDNHRGLVDVNEL